MTSGPLAVAVFASGGGSNFQALLDHQEGECDWRVGLLICNREAGAVERAASADVPAVVIPTKERSSDDVAAEMLAALDQHRIDVLLLAGYLRLLPGPVIERYRGRILNIHPALLPEFGGQGMYGIHVHRAVIEADVEVTGATVHSVDEEYDRGAIVGQWRVSVRPGDTPESVAARVLNVEHQLYPRAVDHLCAAVRAGRDVGSMATVYLEEPPPFTKAGT